MGTLQFLERERVGERVTVTNHHESKIEATERKLDLWGVNDYYPVVFFKKNIY